MNAPISLRMIAGLSFAAGLALFSTGCSVLRPGNLNSKPLDEDALAKMQAHPHDAAAAVDNPTVTVSIKSEFGRRKTVTLPLEYGMTLQDALTQTRVTRRFRDMQINVLRVTPQSKGQRVPLQADYDPVKNRVSILHDMTLHPGDHIMIVEDSSTAFDDAIGRLTGKRR